MNKYKIYRDVRKETDALSLVLISLVTASGSLPSLEDYFHVSRIIYSLLVIRKVRSDWMTERNCNRISIPKVTSWCLRSYRERSVLSCVLMARQGKSQVPFRWNNCIIHIFLHLFYSSLNILFIHCFWVIIEFLFLYRSNFLSFQG